MGGFIKCLNNFMNLGNLSFNDIQIFSNQSFMDIDGEVGKTSQINMTNITFKNITWYKMNDFEGILKVQGQSTIIFFKSLHFLSSSSGISFNILFRKN